MTEAPERPLETGDPHPQPTGANGAETTGTTGAPAPGGAPGHADTGASGGTEAGASGGGDTSGTGNSGAIATGNDVGGDFYQHINQTVVYENIRDALRQRLLDPDRVATILRAYVPPPGGDHAAEVLTRRHAVVLVGRDGTGRRTTALRLLADHGLTLHELALEADDDLDALRPETGCGYLCNAGSLDIDLEEHVGRLRKQNAFLVVWSTQGAARHAGTFLADLCVELKPPEPDRLFQAMLDARLRPDEARWWASRPELELIVKAAPPADIARLVGLIRRTPAPDRDDGAVSTVVDAYRNWEAYLRDSFAPTALDLRGRVLLVTVALLEGAPEAVVYQAAASLGEALGLPPEEGQGLAGAGVHVLATAGEVTRDAGSVRFGKPDFATSVLDYVGRIYPSAWESVWTWAVGLPGRLRTGPDGAAVSRLSAVPARTLVSLAIRRSDLTLVQHAVAEWSASPATRSYAVEALARAALAPGLGAYARRWMYECAYYRSAPVATLIAIAEACAQYGTVYPENALIRLRHLAAVDSRPVRRAVREAVAHLAGQEEMRARILDGIALWAKGSKAAAAGCEAFLDIVDRRDGEGRPVVIDEIVWGRAAGGQARRLGGVLSVGWQAALVTAGTAVRARSRIADWLDEALSSRAEEGDGRERAEAIIRVLGRGARGDARYLPRLVAAVDAWHGRESATPDRDAVRRAVITSATGTDPLSAVMKGDRSA